MKGAKVLKISLEDSGCYLGREKGCLVVKNRKEGTETRFPLFENELGEVMIRSGNTVSAGAIVSMAFWGIPLIVTTARGNPIAVLVSFDNSSHVLTRLHQYETMKTTKAFEIAKQFVLGKLKGQDQVLRKYGLRRIDYFAIMNIKNLNCEDVGTFRRKLAGIEGKCSTQYFSQIFQLFPEILRPKGRITFKAYDGINNCFNMAYEMLKWKIHLALIKAKLEPYLGFLHSVQFGKPSLVCDFQELYRFLVDDLVIAYSKNLSKSDFVFKAEMYADKKSKRQYLNEKKTKGLTKELNALFRSKVEIPRIKVGKRQEIETLINEEALLFAKYLRNEIKEWIPRIANLT